MRAIRGLDELCRDPEPIAFLADTALEQMINAKLLADNAQILVLPFELEGRGSPDDA